MEINKDDPIIPAEKPTEEPNMFDAPKRFKTKWLEEDKKCSACGQITERSRGLTKQNVQRLFIGKPTIEEWTILFMLICVLFLGWRYSVETAKSAYMAEHFQDTCTQMGYILAIANNTHSYTDLIPKINFFSSREAT